MSSQTKLQAYNALMRRADEAKSVIAVAAELRELGGFEQAAEEAVKRIDKLLAQEKEIRLRGDEIISAAHIEAEKIRETVRKHQKDAQEGAMRVMAAADAEAERTIQAAHEKVREHQEIVAGHLARVDELKTETARLRDEREETAAELDAINGKIDDANAEHARVLKVIADARAKLG